jgi:hypothetical protein
MFVIPPFALMQKVEPKMEASPNGSACFATNAQQRSLQHSSFPYFVPRSMIPFCMQLFQILMPFLQV